MSNQSEVRYIHFDRINVTFKFVKENERWVCVASEEYLDAIEQRLNNIKDDLK
jgi:hypothetical protein